MNSDNPQQGSNGSNQNHQQQQQQEYNPYAILNTSKYASIEDIQKSYKLLSRSFHPDKQPIQNRNEAQQYFIQLKEAYDILMDPTLKFVYDHFGYYQGVLFLKRHAKLHKKLSSILEGGRREDDHDDALYDNMGSGYSYWSASEQKALHLFNEARKHYDFQMEKIQLNKPKLSASVQVNCNTTHSRFLQEGIEPLSLDVDETKVSISFSQQPPHPQHHSKSSNTAQKHKKISYSCNASSTLKATTGTGSTDGQLSVEYEPVQGTELHANISSSLISPPPTTTERKQGSQQQKQEQPKVTIGSSRIMSNMTYVHASLSAPLKSFLFPFNTYQKPTFQVEEASNTAKDRENDWLLSFTSHRSLFEDKIRCTWISGIVLPDCKLQYGMISISTNSRSNNDDDDDDDGGGGGGGDNDNKDENKNEEDTNEPQNRKKKESINPIKYALKFNLGMNHTPLQITATKDISERQTGTMSFGYGPMGLDIKLLSTRLLSKVCKLSLGVRHITTNGFSTLFQLERDGMNFSVPVLITTATSREYFLKSIYASIVMSLIDGVIGENINDDSNDAMEHKMKRKNASFRVDDEEERMYQREKKKRDRVQQLQLMTPSATTKMLKEQKKEEGLVILMGRYEVNGGESIDVTIPLQFWVMDSALHLPSMSKSNMLGFYDVRPETPLKTKGLLTKSWQTLLNEYMFGRFGRDKKAASRQQKALMLIPTLTVRYRYGDDVYEITIFDHEELFIPCEKAMRLGESLYVS
jgi:curved DNA-binding protein CbpA